MKIAPPLLRPIIDFALPPRCPACGTIVADDGRFCLDCWEALEFITPPWCEGCGRPFEIERPGERCAECLAKPPRHDGVRAAVAYDDVSRAVVLRLKYSGRIGLAGFIAQQLRRHLPEKIEDRLLVPVPLHRGRIWSRGFNQAALIAAALHELSAIPFMPALLERVRRTPPLRGMSPAERRRAVRRAFRIDPANSEAASGRHVLLVDDVYTSGATANGCASILKRAGARSVTVYCWARVLNEPRSPG